MAVCPPEFLEYARIERHWSKAFHSGVARTGYHRVAAALEDRYPKSALVPNGKPIAIRTSHCKKSLHACCCYYLDADLPGARVRRLFLARCLF